jgi:hypothetical protein
MKKPLNRPHSLKELARLFRVSAPTLRKWIKPVLQDFNVPRRTRIYPIRLCQAIFAFLGMPS